MPLYENKSCPVCHQPFQEGDDVVYCPECGTPHHRACYQQLNHCANERLHGTGFSYFDEEQPVKTDNIVQEARAQLKQESRENANEDHEISQPFGSFPAFGSPVFKTAYENDTDTIGGESVADVAAAVRTNTPRFINIFKKQEKTGKKASWNWGAFFFGAYYYFYRKMFKQGVLLLVLNFAVNFAASFTLQKLAPKTVESFNELSQTMMSGESTLGDLMNFSKTVAYLDDYQTYRLILIGFLALLIVITLFFTVYADYFYKNTIIQLIKNTKERLSDNDELPLSVQTQEGIRLSDEQLKRLYLAQRGGTAILPVILAMLALHIINLLIQ